MRLPVTNSNLDLNGKYTKKNISVRPNGSLNYLCQVTS